VIPLTVELAREWWRIHSPDGIYGSAPLGSDESDREDQVDDSIAVYGLNPDTLGTLIELLAITAPVGRLPYIGTWQLENAYPKLGDEVFAILEATNLPAPTKMSIRQGFAW
jgi:hypothetical protein